jgi:hypothetical protein
MRARRHVVTLWLCAAIQVVASIQPALGLSLCVADDGHTTFELAHADPGCAEELRRHHPDAESFAGDELMPHSCRDVSIVESRLHRLVGSHRLDVPAAVALVPPSVAGLCAPRLRCAARGSVHAAITPAPDLLRSVVLVV